MYSFDCFLYTSLLQNGHEGVKTWTNNINIFEPDLILIPIHNNQHWSFLCVDNRIKRIRYYDSMGGSNIECRKTILEYLKVYF